MASVWDRVHGQDRAIARLKAAASDPVHAYLFVGPPGCTKNEAARAFAALVLAGRDDPESRDARLALAGEHPDVREVERVGATISKDQVSEIVRYAALSPVEGSRQVIVLHEFHLLDATAAARLLKTIEEPPPATLFVVLADMVTTDLVTIASRCVQIDFGPVPADVIEQVLLGEAVDPAVAATVASVANGNLERARRLATDPDLLARRDAFADVPRRLDGTGRTVVALCTELFGLIDAAAAALTARQAIELTELDARVKASGERGSGRKTLEERHKRELRRHRADELRAGLGIIAGTYRDALVDVSPRSRPDALVSAVDRIMSTIEFLDRNPNETLQVQALLSALPSL